MRTFRNRLRQAILATPVMALACSSAPSGSGKPIVGNSAAAGASGGAPASGARGTSAGSSSSASTGGQGFTAAAATTGGPGGSTTGPSGFSGEVVCPMVDAGVCPLCVCGDYYSLFDAGPDPVSSCNCASFCPPPVVIGAEYLVGCSLTLLDGGGYGADCYWATLFGAGRQPFGLRPYDGETRDRVGAHLARQAWMEAASVVAFDRLADELSDLGSDRALIAAARRFALDERVHAELVGRHARRCGAPVPTPEVNPRPERSLRELAVENAVEGCVGETWGAAVAAWQARHAPGDLRRDALRISDDEANHAELAWSLAGWLDSHLTDADRRAVKRARDGAVLHLARRYGPDDASARALGVPTGVERRALIRNLARELWT